MLLLSLLVMVSMLLLLLKEVHTAQTEAHHVCGHHVWEHVWEAERHGLLVMTTGSCTELLQALKLSLSLSKVCGEVATSRETTDTAI